MRGSAQRTKGTKRKNNNKDQLEEALGSKEENDARRLVRAQVVLLTC